MAINNVTSATRIPATSGTVSSVDNESNNLKQQLLNKQQRLNHLTSDSEMTAKEKAKERQEIEKQIAELNRKLELQRMKEEEEAKEAQKEEAKKDALQEEILSKEQSKEDSNNNQEEKQKEISSSMEHIQKVLSTEILLQQMRMKENINTKTEQTANVLEAEIKSDSLYGNDTTAKEESLSKLRKTTDFIIEEKPQEEPTPPGMHSGAKIIIRE